MKLSHLAIAAALASMATVSLAQAQSSNSKVAPAEYPPASYKGAQYVDSRGCVYIRAGVDGNISWIPRLTRKRKHICGQQPTQVAGATQQAPQQQAQRRVVQITLDPEDQAVQPVATPRSEPVKRRTVRAAPVEVAAVAAPRVERAPTQQTQVVAKAAPKKVRVRKVAPTPVTTVPRATTQRALTVAKPKPVVAAAKPVIATPSRPATALAQPKSSVCPGKTAASQRYIQQDGKHAFRCGPQGGGAFAQTLKSPAPAKTQRLAFGNARSNVGAVPSTELPSSTRVLPRHVAQQRAQIGTFSVPKGYRPAWEDDRLNPRRAEGTLGGRDQMNLVWTAEVPRRLIDRSSGRDVTAKVALVYPYTDVAVQQRELGTVTLITRNGQRMKRIVRNRTAQKSVQTKPVVATRSASPRENHTSQNATGELLRGTRYVQVGTFGQQGNAQATAKKIKRLGLPVRIGKFSRSGKTLRMVLAGPFADDATANRALAAAQRAGFSDAFLRK